MRVLVASAWVLGCGRGPAARLDASISADASVSDDASISGDAPISGDASVSDDAFDGGSADSQSDPTFTVGGEVEGLSRTLVLQNNGGDDLSVAADGPFVFITPLADGAPYEVTVFGQPTSQHCTVSRGVGVVSGAPVTDVRVSCEDVMAGPTPLYPTHGANWNDYVKNDGTGPLDASDTACDAENDGPDYFACLHAGELRSMPVPGRTDCGSLSATDDLDAFVWLCDPSTDPVRVVSTGLREGKHLSDLLDFTAGTWRDNVVRVSDGASLLGRSAPAAWWENPIEADPTDEELTGESTVYLFTEPEHRHELHGDRSALVVQPGVVISPPTPMYALAAVSADFLWIEGAVEVLPDLRGLIVVGARFSVLRGISVHGSSGVSFGIQLDDVNKSVVSDVDIRFEGAAIYFSGANHLILRDVSIDCRGQTGATGLDNRLDWDSTGLVLDRVQTRDCNPGVWLNHISGASMSNVTVVGGSMWVEDLGNSHVWNLRAPLVQISDQTWGNNTYWSLMGSGLTGEPYGSRFSGMVGGLVVQGAVEAMVMNATNTPVDSGRSYDLTSVNVMAPDLSLDGAISPVVDDLVAVTDAGRAVRLGDVEEGQFSGLLKVGDTGTECWVSGGSNPGLVDDVVGGDTNCGLQGASTATIVGSTSVAESFVGKVMTDDAVNTSDVDGAAAYEDIDDWVSFENEFRLWGTETAGVVCEPGQVCRIWDWSLRATDTVLRDVHPTPDGNDANRRVWFLATSWASCSHFTGQVWDDAAGECVSVFLRHAVERMLDDTGNENLLCESGETCIFSPNIGAYQGHGDLIPHATIGTGGIIENVTLLRYEFNGR